MWAKIRNILRYNILFVEVIFLLMSFANMWVYALTNGRMFSKISRIPPRETALVLGTSPKMKSGRANPYFVARMEAVAKLYHYGKIKKIIVSGEKSVGYNEPLAMKNYLIYQEGVPEHIITEDPKGFKTHMSIKRSKEIYRQDNIIIVSQGFHNMRALFFARNNGMNALAFEATQVTRPESYFRNQSREFLARVLAVVYYVVGKEPKG